MNPAEKLLRELIALPSVNPAFLSAQHPNAGEKRVADFLCATAASAGLDVQFADALPGRPNLLVRLAPPGKIKQRILLAPHLDTVNSTPEGFVPTRKGDRLYGRGACDTKGCVAAMLSAVIALANGKTRPAETEIIFAGLIDEECGQTGSRALADSGFKADLAIVGEPTENKIVTAHKGSLWLKLETRGKSAHGARPELGINAVHEMARIIDLLQTKYAAQLKKRRHPLLGNATISVGTVNGGSQPNIVPNHCVMTADRRSLPGETEASIRRELQALLRAAKLKAQIGKSKAHSGLPMETNFKLPLVQQFFRTIGQTKPVGVDYFCDASILSKGGTPSIVFGPGNIAQAHTIDEWISIKSLERGTAMLHNFLQSLP
ncbi:MAG: M20 family metallopeptidase [Verrucomicrobia bacterium]|nr:M20 family metallopeptidase [Verrucomicrobiota bacterium]